ncbi:hypothetical protein ACH4PX_33795 [Streptomyces anulatus]
MHGCHHQEHGHGQGDDVGALRAELERVRQERALAVAEAEHGRRLAEAEARRLRAELAARVERIADLQQTVRALMQMILQAREMKASWSSGRRSHRTARRFK